MGNSELNDIIGGITRRMEEADRARERALPTHRQAIREASLAIRAVHRGDFDEARQHLDRSRQALDQVTGDLREHPEVYYAGFLQDAEKEYAEANLTFQMVTGAPFLGPEELRVGYAPYLNGLAEAVGELRRHILDQMRRGQIEDSERLLGLMDDIFYVLTTVDFPDAITRGLRRSTDLARGCLEKTRGDLTAHYGHLHLEREIERLRSRLPLP